VPSGLTGDNEGAKVEQEKYGTDGSAYPGHISIAAQSPGLQVKSRVTERFAGGSSSG